ncbi:hypothetical protein OG689_00395 [Kitasatospora sp. NBC_00240]|uniref:hypothetical protein n=1 Tax=Kitasatospora sp. NBC_00240 TaxID=2903567 RepID=UPI00224FC37B|nr:hypothetical protein [Kitasatospora sp. NBC_00240]MCX5207792.1 hypothetical protein [Kitasatospora sp. NBC_00240]
MKKTPRRGTAFEERMVGTARLTGEAGARPIRLDLSARADRVLRPHRTTGARLTGRVRIAGLADDPAASGELEISPLARRRIRYRLDFTAAGRRLTLHGWKSLTARRPLASLTVLPFTLLEDGAEVGRGTLRFPVATALLPFLTGWRFPRPRQPDADLLPHPDATPGRTEVWYTTLTDPATGTGLWLHHELTTPTDGRPAHAHGWIALFPPDGPAGHARYGPQPPPARDTPPEWLRGEAGAYRWDLTERPTGPPLHTFPRWAWRRPVLPAAHMLPAATARYTGTVHHPGGTLVLDGAPGATARIRGHGSARRWAWLHADLGGGDVLEVVAAVAHRPGLRHLPPLVLLRLRRHGRVWPRSAVRSALGGFRARIGLTDWSVTGRAALRRITVTVRQPPERTLTLDYTDPDGSRAVCRNSEAADAEITVERWWGRWRPHARWQLTGTAHAEVGHR